MEEEKEYTCMDCANICSFQGEGEVVCNVWCSETDRDFTFGNSDITICELFKLDE